MLLNSLRRTANSSGPTNPFHDQNDGRQLTRAALAIDASRTAYQLRWFRHGPPQGSLQVVSTADREKQIGVGFQQIPVVS